MKRWQTWLITAFVVISVLAVVGCSGLTPPSRTTSAATPFFSQQNTGVWVTGEGKVSAAPDIVLLTLGVQAQASTVAEAQSQAASAMNAVVTQLQNHNVASKDIQTQRFSIEPVINYKDGQQILIGYLVSNIVVAKVRKLDDTGPIIDDVTRAGGNFTRINNISFTIDDPSPLLKQARDKAMADAQAKADQLATLGKVKLGRITYINESGGYTPPPLRAIGAGAAPAPVTPISPGELQITLNVQVVYSIQ